ncbi:MAG TPA: DUF4974 domain-containing protein [Cyclobacteriaceae bacterium]|nr:DUF4974 domain-containing protein [Cyclobacteriaceae bacterium]
MDIAQLIRILDGTADATERDTFSHWMASNETHRQEFKQIRQLWQLAQGPWPKTMDQEPLEKIRTRVMQRARQRQRKNVAITMATTLVLVVGSWMFWPRAEKSDLIGERMTFNHQSLEEIAILLEDKFNTQISISTPETEVCVFTGTFSKTSTLDDIMNALSRSLDVRVESTRSGYAWKSKGC